MQIYQDIRITYKLLLGVFPPLYISSLYSIIPSVYLSQMIYYTW